jgi:hypothetical protein
MAPQMGRVLSIIVACIVIAIFASPFVRDSWEWFRVSRDYPLTQQDRDALRNWQGTPGSFIAMIRGQCRNSHPTDPRACIGYDL